MFNVNEAIRAELAGSELDPSKIAKAVADSVPEVDVRAVLAWALRSHVATAQNNQRLTRHPVVPLSAKPVVKAVAGRAPGKGMPKFHQPQMKAQWEKELAARLHVPFGIGRLARKRYADLTMDDFLYGATLRRNQASANVTEADKLEVHAKLLAEHGAKTFADLPVAVQLQAFQISKD